VSKLLTLLLTLLISLSLTGCGGGGGSSTESSYDNIAPTGSEFRINTYTVEHQKSPSIASFNNGGFIVAWHSSGQDGSSDGIYAQRYDANGNTIGSEFQVNTNTQDSQAGADVATFKNDSFVIAWESLEQDGSYTGIFAQRFDVNGSTIDSEFQVNTYTTNWQRDPSIAVLNDGGFVITWYSREQDSSLGGDDRIGGGVYAQRYDSNGNSIGAEFQVNTYTVSQQHNPSIVALTSGGFVITWESEEQDGSFGGIYAQRYDANGNTIGSEFQVNTYTTDDQGEGVSLSSLNNSGFVIAWTSNRQDSSFGHSVYAQRYDANGGKAGPEFKVNSSVGDQGDPDITTLNDGGFVVSWTSINQSGDDSEGGIFAQRFDVNGSTIDSEFQVNTYTTNWQANSSMSFLNDGGFIVTWESEEQDGSESGVYGQRYE
jgi:hypothetical protein